MSSTVTTVTATAMAAAMSNPALAAILSLLAVSAFLAALIGRESLGAYSNGPYRILARGLTIGLVPLGLAFLMIALARVLQALT